MHWNCTAATTLSDPFSAASSSVQRLTSLAVGGLLVDVIGIQGLYWGRGLLLLFAGRIGLVLVDPRIR